VREFPSGATRDDDQDKIDYEGFLSPLVLRRYGQYMHAHRTQVDGNRRPADNWQKGMPKAEYMKSLIRHTIGAWLTHRGGEGDIQDLLCAVMFNAMGYLYEDLREHSEPIPAPSTRPPWNASPPWNIVDCKCYGCLTNSGHGQLPKVDKNDV
jgi:hypothetical protein